MGKLNRTGTLKATRTQPLNNEETNQQADII